MWNRGKYVYLPEPLPDESLYGVISRFAAHMGLNNGTCISVKLFGTTQLPTIDLPTNIDSVAATAYPSLGLSALDCVKQLTIYPYMARHIAPSVAERLMAALRTSLHRNIHNVFGLASSRVRTPEFLRVCPECVAAQRSLRGEAYWTRTHQLPGVPVCPEHQCWLLDTSVPYRSPGSRKYHDAESVADQAHSQARVGRPGVAFLRIARRCAAALRGAPIYDNYEARLQSLRTWCAERGGANAISQAFVLQMGEEILDYNACAVDPCSSTNWLVNLIRRPEGGFHPLQRVMLEEFLSETEMPSPSEMRRCLRSRTHTIARARPGEVQTLRRKWVQALAAVPGRSRSLAARTVRPTYERLCVIDREWLAAEPPRRSRGPGNERRVDWLTRDEHWEPLIRAAATSLRHKRPPIRLSRAALAEEAGLPKGVLSRLDRLPTCRVVVEQSVEATDAFHVRLLNHAAETLSKPNLNDLRRITKLTGPLGPLAVRAVRRLTQGP